MDYHIEEIERLQKAVAESDRMRDHWAQENEKLRTLVDVLACGVANLQPYSRSPWRSVVVQSYRHWEILDAGGEIVATTKYDPTELVESANVATCIAESFGASLYDDQLPRGLSRDLIDQAHGLVVQYRTAQEQEDDDDEEPEDSGP